MGLKQLLWVFLAGGLGASLRVALGAALERAWGDHLVHVGTLSANLIGCLLIGIGSVALPPGPARTAVLGGFLGGFTTYSAFALFSVELARDDRWGVLATQLGLHLVGGVVAVVAGVAIARSLGLGPG